MKLRARLTRRSRRRAAAGGESASGGEGLSQRSDEDVGHHAGGCAEAAACWPDHAEGVRFIDDQDGVVILGGFRQPGERGGVPVHAEEGLGDQQPAAGGTCLVEEACGSLRISVGIDGDSSAREAAAVDDAGMVECIGDDHVIRACQGGQDADVGLIARGEDERGLAVEESGQLPLELAVRRKVAGDQSGGGGAETLACGGSGGSGGQGRVIGQAEVVV